MATGSLWPLLVGETIASKYRLTSLLGEGGFGAVFLAKHFVNDCVIRRVAIKLISNDQPDELIQSTGLDHPNLLRSLDAGEWTFKSTGFLYMVMDVADESLEQKLRCAPLTHEELVEVVAAVASGLDYLHSRGRCHGDLKPGNILRVGGRWQISDFGTLRDIGVNRTAAYTGTILGTLEYMPPESFEGVISPAWDIWSLGVLIVKAASGKFPYAGDTQLALMTPELCTPVARRPGHLAARDVG
ncbi:MAG: serine/threonine protein kinase [Acidobacteria bacterium]|nr:serine/threonine protein kinase [Acidobacteriota bacterium]